MPERGDHQAIPGTAPEQKPGNTTLTDQSQGFISAMRSLAYLTAAIQNPICAPH